MQAKNELDSLFGAHETRSDSADAEPDLDAGEEEAARRKLDDLFDD